MTELEKLINKGFEEFKAKEPYPHIDKKSFEAGAKCIYQYQQSVKIPYEDIEEAAKEIISKDWQEQQDRLWRMIERNLRAQFIAKACEWMDCYIDNYLFIDAENKAGIRWDGFINDFRKAMKGE